MKCQQVEGEAEEQKWGSKALSEDVDESLWKLELNAFDSLIESAGTRRTSTLKRWTGKTRRVSSTTARLTGSWTSAF